MENILSLCKKQFYMAFDMLALLPGPCSDTLWYKKKNGKAFWHLIFHVLSGIHYWLQLTPGELADLFPGKTLYPDFEEEQKDTLTKEEINKYMKVVRTSCDSYFRQISEDFLTKKSPLSDSATHLDLILIVMRHIQYHVGECNAILKENKLTPVDWIE